MNYLDSGFIDQEDLLAKYNLLELLQDKNKYYLNASFETKYFRRVEESIKHLPIKYHIGALALFGNVFYITDPQLADALKYINFQCHNIDLDFDINNTHIFEVDPSGLIVDFCRVNKITGRLDIDKYSRINSVDHLADKLLQLINTPTGDLLDAEVASILSIKNKKFWLLLTDYALSGTSLCSDVTKLCKLREIIFGSKTEYPAIIVGAQILTHDAKQVFENRKYDRSINLLYALYFSKKTKINDEECRLFSNSTTLNQVKDLCEWFYKEYVCLDPEQIPTIEKSKFSMAYGFKDCGYTIIPQRNSPSNSIPLLWYEPSQEFKNNFPNKTYKPPFPRTISRTSQKSGFGLDKISILIGQKLSIRKILRKYD